MTTAQLFILVIGILVMIVMVAAIIHHRRRSRAARHHDHLVVDMARPETIADTGLPETQEAQRSADGAADSAARP